VPHRCELPLPLTLTLLGFTVHVLVSDVGTRAESPWACAGLKGIAATGISECERVSE